MVKDKMCPEVRSLRIKTIKRAAIGFLLGIAVGNLIVWLGTLTGGNMLSPDLILKTGSETAAMALQSFAMGVFGAAAMGGMSLYEIDHWPLAQSTAVHYLMIAVLYLLMDRLLGWNGSMKDIITVELIQLAVFFAIWLIIYFRCRQEVRSLNEELRRQNIDMEKKKDTINNEQ